jgi:heterodisulfide reductase subunit A-like polyferredoxin
MTEPRKDDDPLDVSLEDTALLAEVGLLADLIVAAQEADQHLDAEEIDRVLGLGPEGS